MGAAHEVVAAGYLWQHLPSMCPLTPGTKLREPTLATGVHYAEFRGNGRRRLGWAAGGTDLVTDDVVAGPR